MNKKLIRLTESDLHRIIKESVNKILNEMSPEKYLSYQDGRMRQAASARQQGDYDAEERYRQKAIQGGNMAGDAMRKRHGFDSLDDFNKTQKLANSNNTQPWNNPKYQNYLNYQNDMGNYYMNRKR